MARNSSLAATKGATEESRHILWKTRIGKLGQRREYMDIRQFGPLLPGDPPPSLGDKRRRGLGPVDGSDAGDPLSIDNNCPVRSGLAPPGVKTGFLGQFARQTAQKIDAARLVQIGRVRRAAGKYNAPATE